MMGKAHVHHSSRMRKKLMLMQVVGVISGALKALGNTHAPITKSLIELYVAVLASGGVPTVLASGPWVALLSAILPCPL